MNNIQFAKRSKAPSLRALNEWRKQALSERLRTLMDKKGLTVAQAAKLVQERLPGSSFNSANISHYRAGRSLPRPSVIKALSAVLEVDPEDLVPSQASDVAAPAEFKSENMTRVADGSTRASPPVSAPEGSPFNSIPEFQIAELPGGEALLQINQRLPWSTVIKILQALKGDDSGKT